MKGRARCVGFVVDDRMPTIRGWRRGDCGPLAAWRGAPSGSPCGFMRFGWVADWVNAWPNSGLRYEWYRPFRRYDGLIFLKSMGLEAQALAVRSRHRWGAKSIFDCNVDYFTPPQGTFRYAGMAPTALQREQACSMTGLCDAVIADSEHVADKAKSFSHRVAWIPDNVNLDLAPPSGAFAAEAFDGRKLRLLWSGEAAKLNELLRIETVLRALADRIRLVVVTSDLIALEKWNGDVRERFDRLLGALEVDIIPFRSIAQLFGVYLRGGVFISPRFLDNTYNLGHTEWKITLAMACGTMVLCSPQPSYVTVSRLGGGVRICDSDADWIREIEDLLARRIDPHSEGIEARKTVEAHYSTSVVARRHAHFVRSVMED